MLSLFLVTIINVAAVDIAVDGMKSPSTLVRERMVELKGLGVKEALDMIQLRTELPAEIKVALRTKQHKQLLRKDMSLVQGKETPEEKTARQLDEARVILNKMYEANQEELDIIIWDCRVFLNDLFDIMEENTRLRTEMASAAAQAKRVQLEANAEIKEAQKELDETKKTLEIHEAGCAETLGAAREQEAILANDYEVGMMIQNATEETCARKDTTALVQCSSDSVDDEMYEFGSDFKDVDTRFTSKAAKESMQRMLKMTMQGHHMHDHEAVEEFFQLSREVMRAKRQGVPAPSPPPADVEMTVAPAPVPVSEDHMMHTETPDRPKCSTDNADCPLLYDQVSNMVGEILDGLTDIREYIAETEEACKATTNKLEGEIAKYSTDLRDAGVKLADGISKENSNMESLRQKNAEYEGLNGEYMDKKEECDAKKMEVINTLCGIKVVRTEVYHNENVFDVLIQDCAVGDWVDGDCSVTCAGGTQQVTREIDDPAVLGAECPPVSRMQKCNQQGCPIDCEINDWSEWSACTNKCGGGVENKVRSVKVEAANGGEACPSTDDAQVCHLDACDADCELALWGEWQKCSKACNGGIEIRRRDVLVDLRGTGVCASEDSKDRFEERACNEEACPPNLVCNSKADIVIMLDGSGSVRRQGFAKTKIFAHKLASRLNFGEEGVKVGLIRFSKKVDVLSQMTFDQAKVLSEIKKMSYPRRNTATSKAIKKAIDVLTAGGRKDVAKEKTVLFIVTDGRPNNAKATKRAAKLARAAGRVVVVPVGTGMGKKGLQQMMSWASFPPEENCLQAKDYNALPGMIAGFVADLCPDLMCRESFLEADASDYIGCQASTRSGLGCQKWTEQSPQAHEFKKDEKTKLWPAKYANANIQGAHNYCRNPDGKAGGIWCYTMSAETPWEYCDPRASNATGW